jgi:hypothetical protein
MSEEKKSKVPTREEAKETIAKGVESAQGAISTAGGFVSPIIDGLVDALGGVSWREVGIVMIETDYAVRRYRQKGQP